MDEHDEMVTVLRSSDAMHVQSVIAMLEGEGIPVEHAGLNHAALLTGMPIEIHLRVPANRREDALALMVDAQTADESRAANVFRVKRTRPGYGVLLGWCAGVLVVFVSRWVGPGFIEGVPPMILGCGVVAGYVYGLNLRRDICSGPSCGGYLPVGEIKCPKCAGTVRGEIKTAKDHFEAVEALGAEGE